jgi:DNA-binding NarL/FixJ family response regulator
MLTRRILIVDEQPLFRLGLRHALDGKPRLRVAGEAGNVHQALRAAGDQRPHVVVVSASLPGITGLTLVETLTRRTPEIVAIVLVETIETEIVTAARRAGAAAVIMRSIAPAELPLAIDRAAASRTVPRATEGAAAAEGLSFRELEVLDCVAHGLSNKEIARELFVTEQTVKNHMTSVFRKLDVEDRVQALLFAVRRGWVTFGQAPAGASRRRSTA